MLKNHTFIAGAIIAFLSTSGCTPAQQNTQNIPSVEIEKTIKLDFTKEYNKGDDQGYQDGKKSESSYFKKLYPLKSSYSQYDLGYLNGYYVGCHETSADCSQIDQVIDQILKDKTGKFEVTTTKEEVPNYNPTKSEPLIIINSAEKR